MEGITATALWAGQSPFSPMVLLLSLLAGVVTSVCPCNLSMVPILLGYLGARGEMGGARGFRLSLAFVGGTAITYVAMGMVAGLVGGLFGVGRQALQVGAALVCVAAGLTMLEVFTLPGLSLGRWLPDAGKARGLGAVTLGAAAAVAGSQCATPVLLVIVTYTLAQGKVLAGALLLLAYTFGRGVPFLVLGTATGAVKAAPWLAKHSAAVQKAAGVVLIVTGAYLLWQA